MPIPRPVAPPARPVTLISDLNQVWNYPSLKAFVETYSLAWIRAYVGENFVETRLVPDGQREVITHPYVLRGDFGEILTFKDCARQVMLARPWWHRALPALLRWNGFGPVPYIHRGRRHHYHRQVRTMAEHRAAAAVLIQEGEPPFRAARNRHNLPSAWDDLPLNSTKDRSWKRYRRTRWKA